MPPRLSPSLAAALISATIASSAAASKQRTGDSSTRGRSAGAGPGGRLGAGRAHLDDVAQRRRRRARPAAPWRAVPAATRAAVSRADARSRTSRASVRPYFCMPARSAWPGRTWVSGACGGPVLGPHRHLLLPLVGVAVPLAVADLDGHRRAEGAAVAHAADDRDLVLLEPHAGPAAVAEAPPGQLVLHLLHGDGQPGRQALDDHDERPPVRLTRRQEPEHRDNGTGRPSPDRYLFPWPASHSATRPATPPVGPRAAQPQPSGTMPSAAGEAGLPQMYRCSNRPQPVWPSLVNLATESTMPNMAPRPSSVDRSQTLPWTSRSPW